MPYGFMMAHFAIRGLMHEAALKDDFNSDRLSYLRAFRVVRPKLPTYSANPSQNRKAFHNAVPDEILQDRVLSGPGQRKSYAPGRGRSFKSDAPADGMD